jgi:hypothetical protein
MGKKLSAFSPQMKFVEKRQKLTALLYLKALPSAQAGKINYRFH